MTRKATLDPVHLPLRARKLYATQFVERRWFSTRGMRVLAVQAMLTIPPVTQFHLAAHLAAHRASKVKR